MKSLDIYPFASHRVVNTFSSPEEFVDSIYNLLDETYNKEISTKESNKPVCLNKFSCCGNSYSYFVVSLDNGVTALLGRRMILYNGYRETSVTTQLEYVYWDTEGRGADSEFIIKIGYFLPCWHGEELKFHLEDD